MFHTTDIRSSTELKASVKLTNWRHVHGFREAGK